MITLYIATHNVTNKKYFGKTRVHHTKGDLQKHYHGSGTYWNNHLKKHKDEVTMEILYSSNDAELIKSLALMYSRFWNIVESNDYANLIDEDVIGGGDLSKYINYNKIDRTGKNNPMYGKSKDNPMAKIIKIYDSNHILMYTCVGNFSQTCDDNDLPYTVLTKYMNTKIGLYNRKRPSKEKYVKFKGWYATSEDKGKK